MTYTAVIDCNFGSYKPNLANVRVDVDGNTISSGITEITGSNGAGFKVAATLSVGFRGPFVFRDDTDATKFCIGSVGPEHEMLDDIDAALTEIKGAGWTTTDTLEAIRDRGDAAWLTATGFSTHSVGDVTSAITALGMTISIASPIDSDGNLTIVRDITLTFTASGTIPATYDDVYFTVKHRYDDDDSEALIQASEVNGLIRINGDSATSGDGSITVDQPNGDAVISVKGSALAPLGAYERLVFDVKWVEAGDSGLISSGTARSCYTATRETS